MLQASCRSKKASGRLWGYCLQLVAIEEAFKNLKGDLSVRPVHHQLEERIEAHIFICFLAYLLLSLLRLHLRSLRLSPEEALRELETMYKVYLRDRRNRFHLSRIVTLTKSQERILRSIDPTLLDRPSV